MLARHTPSLMCSTDSAQCMSTNFMPESCIDSAASSVLGLLVATSSSIQPMSNREACWNFYGRSNQTVCKLGRTSNNSYNSLWKFRVYIIYIISALVLWISCNSNNHMHSSDINTRNTLSSPGPQVQPCCKKRSFASMVVMNFANELLGTAGWAMMGLVFSRPKETGINLCFWFLCGNKKKQSNW